MHFSKNKEGKLAMWLSWVDDILIVEPMHVMKNECDESAKEIQIEIGELKEFVKCKIEVNK